MSNSIIQVEGIGKSYKISHELKASVGNVSIRDGINNIVRKPIELVTGHRMRQEKFWALKDINFEVEQGEVLGIIGKNGSGKSTLLKILSRITEPTTGEIRMHGRVASLLEVGTGFHPELTGRENIYFNGSILGMRKKEIESKFDEIVAFSEVEKFLDTPVKFYSSGMYVRLAFAVAAHLDPDILIIDEVLAVGDTSFQKKCLSKMKDVSGQGRTVLFVSHTMKTVEELCTRALVLQSGLVNYQGSVEKAISNYVGREGKGNSVNYNKGVVKSIKANQQGEKLVIQLVFDNNAKPISPNLGFVILDQLGNKIAGTNPKDYLEHIKLSKISNGVVTAEVTEPLLLDGEYKLSVWFGDGVTDFFSDEECLSFNVKNMVKGYGQSGYQVGASAVKCKWRVS